MKRSDLLTLLASCAAVLPPSGAFAADPPVVADGLSANDLVSVMNVQAKVSS